MKTNYTVPKAHREQESDEVAYRRSGFHEPTGRRPAAFRALKNRPFPEDGRALSEDDSE